MKFAKVLMTCAALALAAGPLTAQDSTNVVSTNTAWSVFEEPQGCWAVATAKETVNTRDGRVVAVKRGDILLYVIYNQAQGVNGQVAFTGGYPFADDSKVEVNVDGTKFQLFVQGEWAWASSADEDAKLVAAMKRGSNAVMTARSSRGTQTKDTFSLLGFTAATDEAAKRCAG
jgi:invasion protein IalB